MSVPQEFPPPPSPRLKLERSADGLQLKLGSRAGSLLPGIGIIVIGVVGMVVLGGMILALGSGSNDFAFGLLCLVLPLMGAVILAGLCCLLLAAGPPTLQVSGDQLRVRVGGLLTGRRWEWPRSSLRVIVADQGLWIVADHGITLLFQTRSPAEVAWVADVLRHALDVSDQIGTRPDELAVEYTQEPDEKYIAAVLFVEPGKISLWAVRPPFSRFLFYPGGESLFQTWSPLPGVRQSVLAESDVACRIWPNEAGSLRVWPGGTQFRLTIWCKDGQRLAEALGRFRGGREDAERLEE